MKTLCTVMEDFPMYEISTSSEIKNIKTGRVLKGRFNSSGYRYVGLRKNKKTYWRLVHRLVAKTFMPDYDYTNKDLVVDHIDGSRHNNELSNLRVISRSENASSYNDIKNNDPARSKRNQHNHCVWYTINDDNTYNFFGSWHDANRCTPGKDIYFQKHGVNVEPEIVK
jgi:hypothetical protein